MYREYIFSDFFIHIYKQKHNSVILKENRKNKCLLHYLMQKAYYLKIVKVFSTCML